MAGNIKGITIEFRGDTTQLDQAISTVDRETSKLDSELKKVNTALKFNPTSIDLWRQKQTLLTQKVAETKEKLAVLKQAQAQMDAKGVDKNSEEYRKLQREIIETESKVKTFSSQLRAIGNIRLRVASEQLKEIGSKATAAGNAMRGISRAAGVVAAGIGALTKKSAKWADDVVTASKVYGTSTKELQKYYAAANLVDVKAESIVATHRKLERNMLNAATGSKKQALAFEKLGVAYQNVDGSLRKGDVVWEETIKALAKMKNETERDAYAMALMGRSATDLNPLILDGAEGYTLLGEAMKKYDLEFVDEETLKRANDFNDQMDIMKSVTLIALQNLGTQLAGVFLPVIKKVVEGVGQFAKWINNLNPRIVAVVGVIAALVAAIAPLLLAFGALATAAGVVMGVLAGITAPMLAIGAAVAALVAAFATAMASSTDFRKAITGLVKELGKAFEPVVKALIETFKSFIKTISQTAGEVAKDLAPVIKQLTPVLSVVAKVISTVLMVALKKLSADFEFVCGVVRVVVTVFTTAFNAIADIVKSAYNTIKKTADDIKNALDFNSIINAVKTTFENVKAGIKEKLLSAKEAVKTVVGQIKTVTDFNSLVNTVKTTFSNVKEAIKTVLLSAKEAVKTVVDQIKTVINFNSIASGVRSAFNTVKDAIKGPLESAKEAVKGLIDRIKGLFPINIGKIFSGLKLPHFTVNGGKFPFGVAGKGYPPSWDVKWYAKGGIFNSPTLAGIGEAGAEAVIPLDKFWKKLEESQGGSITVNVYGSDNMSVTELAEAVEQRIIQLQKRRREAWQ